MVLKRTMILRFPSGQETEGSARPGGVRAQERGLARRLRALGVAFACSALLAGCGGAQFVSYDLSSIPSGSQAGAIRGVLAIAEPHADAALDSERIVIRTGPDQLAYLSGAKWTDTLPRLVQSRLIASFENAHMLKSVVRPGAVADYSLTAEIRHFEIDVANDEARVEIAVRLLADRSGRPLAGKIFAASAPAPKTADGAAALALDAALADAMRRIVAWTSGAI